MMKKKPLIFITNDDGYYAGGIIALLESVKDLGEVVVVAPDGPRSGFSGAITSATPLRYYPIKEEENQKIYVCNGTPVDCVKLGIGKILGGRIPDLVLSGINHGSNSAVSVLYSGTMGAAMEGCLHNVPSIGFSLLDHSLEADFTTSKKVANALAKKTLKEGLPDGTCLNVNIPKGDIKGAKIARQTKGRWTQEYKESSDGGNFPVFWLTGSFANDEKDKTDTDEYILKQGYISIVPVKVDMTDHTYLDKIKDWEKIIF